MWLSFLYSTFSQLSKLPFTLLWLWLPTTRGPPWVVLSGSVFLLPTLSNLSPPPYGSHCPLPKGNAQSMPFYNIFFRIARSTPTGLSNDVLPISMLHNFFWVSNSIPMKITGLGLTSVSHSTIFSIGCLVLYLQQMSNIWLVYMPLVRRTIFSLVAIVSQASKCLKF